MSGMQLPWYISAGTALGGVFGLIAVALGFLVLFDPDFAHEKGPKTNRRAILAIVFGATAWWWLPWAFYGLTLIPWPPIPMPPTHNVTAEKIP